MNRYLLPVVMAVSLACSSMAAGTSNSDKSDLRRVVPVYVVVNRQGRVTTAETPVRLRPSMARALRQTVKAMITKPATKDGKPISSQFILNLAMVPATSDNSEYKFSFVSTQLVPSGTWHWVHEDQMGNQKFALTSDQGGFERGPVFSTMASPRSPRESQSGGSSGK